MATDSSPAIEIRETIDGVQAGDAAAGTPRRKGLFGLMSKKDADPDKASNPKSDTYIWGTYIVLVIVALIEGYSASSSLVKTSADVYKPLIENAVFLFIGFCFTFMLQKVHYKWIKMYAGFIFIVSIFLLVWATVAGDNLNGASRAISKYGISIQPPEIIKLTMVIYLAKILAKYQKPGGVRTTGVIWCALTTGIVAVLLYINGLTNAAMVFCTSLAMWLIGGIEWRKIGIVLLIAVGVGGVAYTVKATTRAETHESRIAEYTRGIKPTDTITDKNRQPMFARFAIARGGIVNTAPGSSHESARLPLAYSDFIYSIIVEDGGIVGGVLLIALYIGLLMRAGAIARKCRRAFPALLIMGCAVMIVLQALVHMVIVVGIVPVSGQPLPLISKGGTSIIVMSMAFGIMLSVSRYAVRSNNKKEIRAELKQLDEDISAINPAIADSADVPTK